MGRSGKYLVKIVLFEATFHFPHSFYGFITSKLKRLYGMYSILIICFMSFSICAMALQDTQRNIWKPRKVPTKRGSGSQPSTIFAIFQLLTMFDKSLNTLLLVVRESNGLYPQVSVMGSIPAPLSSYKFCVLASKLRINFGKLM